MKDVVVIYHKADYDGVFCREIAYKHFGKSAEYIGWDYGDECPFIAPHRQVYMLDISIDALMSYPGLTWIDHHKTAIEKYGDKRGAQIDGVAACRLAWQYFFGDAGIWGKPCVKGLFVDRYVDEPLSVRLAGEYDVWDKRDERADMFQLGLKAAGGAADWASLLSMQPYGDDYTDSLCNHGRLIQRYKQSLDAEIINTYGFDLKWEGLTFLALNTARCNSLSFEAGVKPHHDALLAFRHDGSKYTVSLYGIPENRADLDLSEIAKKYGGGGHKHACGFQCNEPFFLTQRQ